MQDSSIITSQIGIFIQNLIEIVAINKYREGTSVAYSNDVKQTVFVEC